MHITKIAIVVVHYERGQVVSAFPKSSCELPCRNMMRRSERGRRLGARGGAMIAPHAKNLSLTMLH